MKRISEVAPHKEYIYICEDIIKPGDSLVWYTRLNWCKYYSCYDASIIGDTNKLPYLKFDIEASQLKLYLTFS
jgi:hypothetical protein